MTAAPPPACSVTPPEEVAWLVALIGEAATLALVEARGGTRIWVPGTEQGFAESYLVGIIGAAGLAALARERRNTFIALPVARAWRVRLYLARGGMSQAEIALRTGATENYVQKMADVNYKPLPPVNWLPRKRRVEARQTSLPL